MFINVKKLKKLKKITLLICITNLRILQSFGYNFNMYFFDQLSTVKILLKFTK